MKFSAFILTLLVVTTVAKGGGNRHPAPQETVNIDDVIRAEEDPDFPQYLREREREKRQERAAALEYERQRQAEERAYHKAQLQYLKEEQERAARESSTRSKRQIDEPKAWAQQQERYRQEYELKRQKELEKQKSERSARIQKVMNLERMPASEN